MDLKKIARIIKPPCPKCPYTLGQVHTLVDPCPQCKANGYRSYELFKTGQVPDGKKTKGGSYGTR